MNKTQSSNQKVPDDLPWAKRIRGVLQPAVWVPDFKSRDQSADPAPPCGPAGSLALDVVVGAVLVYAVYYKFLRR
jgi:hypothetical protein